MPVVENVGGVQGAGFFLFKKSSFTNYLTLCNTNRIVKPFYKTTWHKKSKGFSFVVYKMQEIVEKVKRDDRPG